MWLAAAREAGIAALRDDRHPRLRTDAHDRGRLLGRLRSQNEGDAAHPIVAPARAVRSDVGGVVEVAGAPDHGLEPVEGPGRDGRARCAHLSWPRKLERCGEVPELSRLRRGNQSDAGAEKRPAAAPLAGDLPSGSRSPHRTIRHACVRRACLGARNRQVTGIQDNQDSAPPFDTENDHENHPLSRPGFVCAFGHRGSAGQRQPPRPTQSRRRDPLAVPVLSRTMSLSQPRDLRGRDILVSAYRFGNRSKLGRPAGIWWKACLSMV